MISLHGQLASSFIVPHYTSFLSVSFQFPIRLQELSRRTEFPIPSQVATAAPSQMDPAPLAASFLAFVFSGLVFPPGLLPLFHHLYVLITEANKQSDPQPAPTYYWVTIRRIGYYYPIHLRSVPVAETDASNVDAAYW